MKEFRIHKDFVKLFHKKEQISLYGQKYRNLIYLCLIISLTYISIGFANGSLAYLRVKMTDPFINWIDIPISLFTGGGLEEIIPDIKSKSIDYNIKNISYYYQLTVQFKNIKSQRPIFISGRTINEGSPLLSNILNKKNLIIGKTNFGKNEIGLIVSQEFLNKLEYDEFPSYIYMSTSCDSTTLFCEKYYRLNVPLPIIAVVKNLPGDNLFICTEFFHKKRSSRNKPFDISVDEHEKRLLFFVEGEETKIKKFRNKLVSEIKKNKISNYYIDNEILNKNSTFKSGSTVEIIFDRNDTLFSGSLIIDFLNELGKKTWIKDYNFYRVFNFNFAGNEEFVAYHSLAIHFRELNKIRQFEEYLKTNHELKIDMSQIESKENYNFVSKLTLLISLFLITFSIISIIIFVNNVLRLHFEKIKANLGTLKAFGLNNKTITKIYIIITLKFLLLASVVSFIIALVLGNIGFIRFVLWAFDTNLETGQNYFSLVTNLNTYIAFLLIFIINSITISWTINKILSNSPGNLINE